jgi:hypothetical protein
VNKIYGGTSEIIRSSVARYSAARHLVEEADDPGQPSVGADGRDIGADHQWLVAVATQTPAEPGDVVVGIDRAGESEDVARELALGGGDARCRLPGR